MYLQCIVLRDPLHHVWHSSLKNLFECQGVHHGEDPSKVLQDLFLLLHAYSLAVGHPDVCLLVIGNLYLVIKDESCYTVVGFKTILSIIAIFLFVGFFL